MERTAAHRLECLHDKFLVWTFRSILERIAGMQMNHFVELHKKDFRFEIHRLWWAGFDTGITQAATSSLIA
jgi:hypothetical protein